MGTNFYAERPACECCERPYERLHIGKSSAGLHGYNESHPMSGDHGLAVKVKTVDDWRALLQMLVLDGWIVRDEYDNDVSPAEVLGRISKAERQYTVLLGHHEPRYHGPLDEWVWRDEGYTFSTVEWS